MSRSSTGCLRLILPVTRGTGIGLPLRLRVAAGIVEVDAFERGGEGIGIALAPLLAVGDDVEARALLFADGDQGRLVLPGLELLRIDKPQVCPHPRDLLRELRAVDQPVGLRIGADETGRQQVGSRWIGFFLSIAGRR